MGPLPYGLPVNKPHNRGEGKLDFIHIIHTLNKNWLYYWSPFIDIPSHTKKKEAQPEKR